MPFSRRMRSLPLSRVRLTDRFWQGYQRRLIERTLPTQYELLDTTGRLENFRRVAAGESGGHQGLYFNDSDVYKYIEACAYALAATASFVPEAARAKVQAEMSSAIETVAAAQAPDGYLNTFFQLDHPTLRWRNLAAMHEMYCAGHLLEAAVAVAECLGDRQLLDVGIRFADHIMSIFGPGLRRGYCGHEELELGLVRLSAFTGDAKYREFARWMVEQRGQPDSPFVAELQDAEARTLSPWTSALVDADGVYSGEYAQDHAPIREHTQVVGHAVRAMYFYAAATDLADGQQDAGLEAALERTWANLTERRMYITGGIGPSAKNEGFTADYDLPNLTAYAETCAAIGLVFWSRRLIEMTGAGEYADVMERALFNGVLSGISLDGTAYFYDNPLESRGRHARTPWFTCACCPPNIARLIGSVTDNLVAEADEAFVIHIPASLVAETRLGGVNTTITMEADYPWSGRFRIAVDPARPVRFALRVRIPEWADEVDTELPDDVEGADYEAGYAVFEREWSAGDSVTIDLGMTPKWMEADPRVRDNLGRVALAHGPLVYCAEQTRNGFAPQLLSVRAADPVEPDRNGDEATFTFPVIREVEEPRDGLYAEAGATQIEEDTAIFSPYFSWGNAGSTNMQVWVRYVEV